MKIALRLAFALSMLSCAVDVFASEIKISGNNKTQTSYIARLIEECADKADGVLTSDVLRQCLMNSKLFSEVSAEVSDQANTIVVNVVERWTLIPLPFYQSSGKNRSAGLFLLDTNFLGRGMTLAAGATSSNRGTGYFLFLTDPSLFFGNWYYNLGFSKQVQEALANEGVSDEVDGYNEVATSVSSGLGYKWGHLSVGGTLAHISKNYSQYQAYDRPIDNAVNRIGGVIAYDKRNFKLYFSEGVNSKLTVQQDVWRRDSLEKATIAEFQLGLQKALFDTQVLQLLALSGGAENGSRGDEMRIGGGRGLRGIDSKSAWVKRYVAGAADYQVPIKSYGAGTWTLAPFVDVGHLEHAGGTEQIKNFTTFGVGTYFFLKQIALPGLGLEFGHNNGYGGNFTSVSVGLGL